MHACCSCIVSFALNTKLPALAKAHSLASVNSRTCHVHAFAMTRCVNCHCSCSASLPCHCLVDLLWHIQRLGSDLLSPFLLGTQKQYLGTASPKRDFPCCLGFLYCCVHPPVDLASRRALSLAGHHVISLDAVKSYFLLTCINVKASACQGCASCLRL